MWVCGCRRVGGFVYPPSQVATGKGWPDPYPPGSSHRKNPQPPCRREVCGGLFGSHPLLSAVLARKTPTPLPKGSGWVVARKTPAPLPKGSGWASQGAIPGSLGPVPAKGKGWVGGANPLPPRRKGRSPIGVLCVVQISLENGEAVASVLE